MSRGRGWKYDSVRLAQALVARGATDEECIAAVGRSFKSCETKVKKLELEPLKKQRTFRMPRLDLHAKPPQHLLLDAERRKAAPRSLTALICGDPPRGFSALDQRL